MCEYVKAQEEAIWLHYGQGCSARQIGRDLGINYRTATRYLNKFGGIQPAARSRAKNHLSVDDREEISRGIAADLSANAIAGLLGRSPSTISREIARPNLCGSCGAEGRATVRERRGEGPSSPVEVAASVYMDDLHRAGVFNDVVDDPVVTSPSRVQAAELAAEGLAYPLWIVGERSEDELDAGRGDLRWQPL